MTTVDSRGLDTGRWLAGVPLSRLLRIHLRIWLEQRSMTAGTALTVALGLLTTEIAFSTMSAPVTTATVAHRFASSAQLYVMAWLAIGAFAGAAPFRSRWAVMVLALAPRRTRWLAACYGSVLAWALAATAVFTAAAGIVTAISLGPPRPAAVGRAGNGDQPVAARYRGIGRRHRRLLPRRRDAGNGCDALDLLCGTPADRRLVGQGGALDRPRRGTQRNQPRGRHAARPGTDDQRPVPVGCRPRGFRSRTAVPVCHRMSSRGESGEIVSARPGIESSGRTRRSAGDLEPVERRGRRRPARRLLLPVLIGWSMATDLHYSPVRVAAAALVVAAVIARFSWPVPALLLASACLSVAPAAAVVAVLVLAYGAAYRISSPYRACAAFAAAWVLVALSALHRVAHPAGTDSLALAAMVGVSCLAPPAAVGALAGARARRLMDLRERNEILQQANLFGESQAKMAERARIAGEMHDLIGHRLSLISLHAGALELGTRATAPQLSEQAVLIRTTAKQALDELREVLGILNADAGGDGPDPEAGDHADTGTRGRRRRAGAGLPQGRNPGRAAMDRRRPDGA